MTTPTAAVDQAGPNGTSGAIANALSGVRAVAGRPLTIAIAACIALAAASLLIPAALSEDPWAWVVWGREIAYGTLHTAGGGSWKPLPVVFTAPYALAGGTAPDLWMLTVRVAALLACVFAARVAWRLAGPVAAVVAGGGLFLIASWVRYATSGISELVAVALLLAAIDAHLSGRRSLAFLLLGGAGLGRPEVWPFLLVYGLILARGAPQRRWMVVAVIAGVGALWVLPDQLSSGNAAAGAQLAQSGLGNRQGTVIVRALTMLVWPIEAAAVVALAFAAARRDRRVLTLGALVLAWTALVLLMNSVGFAGLRRFMVPAAALVTVLAGVGVAQLARAIGRTPVSRAVVAAVLILAALPFAHPKPSVASQLRVAAERSRLIDGLAATVNRAGPAAAITACGRPVVNSSARTALAWYMRARLSVPSTRVRSQSVVFAASATRASSTPPHSRRPRRWVPLFRDDHWKVSIVMPLGSALSASCRRLAARTAGGATSPGPPG